jgi:hypothetical protein
LGVSYSTAWRVKHKLFEAMRQRESRRLLQGVVLADDAVLGGAHAGKPGRGSQNKAPFIAAVELDDDGYPQHARFDVIADYTGATYAEWARSALDPDAHLVSDGLASFNAAGAQVAAHGAIIVGERKSSDLEPFQWVNIFISNVKTSITGTYHHLRFRQVPSPLSRRGAVPCQPPLRPSLVGGPARARLCTHRSLSRALAAARRG